MVLSVRLGVKLGAVVYSFRSLYSGEKGDLTVTPSFKVGTTPLICKTHSTFMYDMVTSLFCAISQLNIDYVLNLSSLPQCNITAVDRQLTPLQIFGRQADYLKFECVFRGLTRDLTFWSHCPHKIKKLCSNFEVICLPACRIFEGGKVVVLPL